MYKPGQGYWTRMMTAIGAGMLVLMGGVWLANHLQSVRIGSIEPLYTSTAAALVVCLIGAFFIYHFVARHERSGDFLIATEGEMKKVNWSSRREVLGSTWVVIGVCLFVTAFVYLCDIVFLKFFQLIRVLETT